MKGVDPDPRFARHTKITRKVVALTIDYDDGERDVLEFLPGSWAVYRVTGNELLGAGDQIVRLYNEHEIRWEEDHWKKED